MKAYTLKETLLVLGATASDQHGYPPESISEILNVMTLWPSLA